MKMTHLPTCNDMRRLDTGLAVRNVQQALAQGQGTRHATTGNCLPAPSENLDWQIKHAPASL